ncbi:glycerol kinase GlpK [Cerasicoccus arenae]|uniref:Glycerol kinase n=1 Tax=Cerasicoccus arenae TaxID=424488 RepID=A0A8J3GDE4_9BACT|nr:glycerol kinase GlpK [Cerasicoccus arenae]MBK1858868.1 glycerol kinase GlpK [Cerasicoccus arenae]GHB96157.1 glycerol kinase [Cerasicoccus arenae]
MPKRYLLALDQGTTSSRAIVFNADGESVASAQREFTQFFPESGWIEHDPNDIWATQNAVAAEAMGKASLRGRDLAGVGITNQRETTLVWERKTGRPIHRAIVWQDRRTSKYCDRMHSEGKANDITQKTGLRLDPYFSGTKLHWILDHVDGARKAAERGELCFGTVDSWLIWNLTGGAVHATDPSNASRTLLYNIHEGQWDEELLEWFGVPHEMLPEVRTSSGDFGECTDFGGATIAGVAGDQHAALFGQTCFKKGTAKNTYGTGCFLLQQTGEKPIASKNHLLTTIAWQTKGRRRKYALEGSVFMGGAVIQWLRDGLRMIHTASESEPLAASVPDTDGVMLVPAFTGLGAPHWDPTARGAIVGLTRGTTAAHIARAALESIAFQSAELLEAMNADSGIALKELRVDGGASRNDLLMQFQADLLGVPVIRPQNTETTALGAAYLAGLATGVFADEKAISEQWKIDRTFEPAMSSDEATEKMGVWRDAVSRAKGWAK